MKRGGSRSAREEILCIRVYRRHAWEEGEGARYKNGKGMIDRGKMVDRS